MRSNQFLAATMAAAVASASVPTIAAPVGTAFTYQGELIDAGVPANDDYDMRFSLFDVAAGGTAVAGPLVFDGVASNPLPVAVFDGLFAIELDFGTGSFDEVPRAFDGRAIWLQVEVQPHGGGGYTALSPRQPITPAPYALSLRLPFEQSHEVVSGQTGSGSAFSITNTADEHSAAIFSNSSLTNEDPALVASSRPEAGAAPGLGVFGPHNDGTTGALRIRNTALFGQVMHLDSNTIDSSGDLYLQENTSRDVLMGLGGGNVGIGTDTPEGKLHIEGGSDVTPSTGGYLILGPAAGGNLCMDSEEIMARGSGGVPARLALNKEGGDVTVSEASATGNLGIGISTPAERLHVVGGTDSEPGGGGYIVAGNTGSINISIDNNEIMARNNGNAATLTLNNDGGDVKIGGTLDIGYEIIVTSPGTEPTAMCSSGKKVLGGGCFVNTFDEQLKNSYPSAGGAGWTCYALGEPVQAYAICARVK